MNNEEFTDKIEALFREHQQYGGYVHYSGNDKVTCWANAQSRRMAIGFAAAMLSQLSEAASASNDEIAAMAFKMAIRTLAQYTEFISADPLNEPEVKLQ